MRHAYFDQYSRLDSFLQHREPRIKIIAFFSFIFFIIFTPLQKLEALCLYAIVIAILALTSQIPLSFIFKRSVAIVPFMLIVSLSHLNLFWNIFLKACLAMLCLLLLTASTPFADFLKALEKLKCPRLIVMILSFMYRYFFLLQDELMRLEQARISRAGIGAARQLRALANSLGVLFLRSYEKSEAVYLAMCARGFCGEIKTLSNLRIAGKDILFLAVLLMVLVSVRFVTS